MVNRVDEKQHPQRHKEALNVNFTAVVLWTMKIVTV